MWLYVIVEAAAVPLSYCTDPSLRHTVLLGCVRGICFVADGLPDHPGWENFTWPFSIIIGPQGAHQVVRVYADKVYQFHKISCEFWLALRICINLHPIRSLMKTTSLWNRWYGLFPSGRKGWNVLARRNTLLQSFWLGRGSLVLTVRAP